MPSTTLAAAAAAAAVTFLLRLVIKGAQDALPSTALGKPLARPLYGNHYPEAFLGCGGIYWPDMCDM